MPLGAAIPAIGPNQVQTVAVDFGNFLPAGVTLTGTPTVTLTVSNGVDADPQEHVASSAVGTASAAIGGTGAVNAAILFQLTGLLLGVVYAVDMFCERSDGDQVEWGFLIPCN